VQEACRLGQLEAGEDVALGGGELGALVDPVLGAAHPRRVGLQERPDQAQVQGPPPPAALALVIARAARPAVCPRLESRGEGNGVRSARLWAGLLGLARGWWSKASSSTRRRRPSWCRCVPGRRPNAAVADRNRKRGTACGASWVSQPPTEESQEPQIRRHEPPDLVRLGPCATSLLSARRCRKDCR